MLRNYLKTIYLNRVVPLNTLRQELSSWHITETSINRKFNLETFDRAVEFMSMANSYTKDKSISTKISNVYNNISVTITTDNQFTDRELNTAKFLDSLEKEKTIEKLLKSDYYTDFYRRTPQIDYNNQDVPTLIDNSNQFLSLSGQQEMKLLR